MPPFGKFGPLVGVIDEGTSNARFLIFAARSCELLTYHQIPIKRLYFSDERVEQDPNQILSAVIDCMQKTVNNLAKLDIDINNLVTIGITNQRETVIIWDTVSGSPLYNAIVWLDLRAKEIAEQLASKCSSRSKRAMRRVSGIPVTHCTFAAKVRWLMDNVTTVKEAIQEKRCKVGTVDSWLLWNLTGGKTCGSHLTDVTNASRTGLMSLSALTWDSGLLKHYGIPQEILPKIKSCSELYGTIRNHFPLKGVYISGVIGNQQAALYGQGCTQYGDAHATYGLGCFILCNTSTSVVIPEDNLITTIAYKAGPDEKPIFALEGCVGIIGEALHWLKENDMLSDLQSVLSMPRSDTGDVCFIPALSGLTAPVWHSSAKGLICNVSGNTRRSHIVFAAIDAACQAARCVVQALSNNVGGSLLKLIVGGSLTEYSALLQAQADACRIPLIHPLVSSCTAIGAAAMAGSCKGIEIWPNNPVTPPTDVFFPGISEDESDVNYERWMEGVQKSLQWASDIEDKPRPITYDRMLTIGLFMMGSCIMLLLANRTAT